MKTNGGCAPAADDLLREVGKQKAKLLNPERAVTRGASWLSSTASVPYHYAVVRCPAPQTRYHSTRLRSDPCGIRQQRTVRIRV